MRFSTKSQKNYLGWAFIPLLLLFSITISTAQFVVYEGKVVDECTGEPLEGVEVNFWGNSIGQTPGSYSEITDANGEFLAPLFGFDTWTVSISSPTGVNDPGVYFFQASAGNQSSVNFSLLPGNWEPILNGSPIPMSNNPSFPIQLCLGDDNCLDLNEEFREEFGGSGTPRYCFRGALYETDRRGNKGALLAESPCIKIGGRFEIKDDPCDPGVNLTEVFELIDVPTEVPLLIEIIQFCCNEQCEPEEGALINRQSFYIEVQEELEFDFAFGANTSIENANASTPGNSDLLDNLVPRTETLPGTLVGPFSLTFDLSPGLDADRIDGYQIIIEEVNCETGNTQQVLFDETVDEEDYPAGGFNPNLELVGPAGSEQLGYFFLNSGGNGQASTTAGKCYKVTIIADSDCGMVERFSYFRLAQPGEVAGCPFCLTDENGNTIAGTSTLNDLNIYPSPTSGLINVTYTTEQSQNTTIDIRDMTGKSLMRKVDINDEAGYRAYEFDLSKLPSGIYLIQILSGNGVMVKKILKE